ncbi:MAG: cytochrome c [Candidatus Baltobacteraceae bacterium]
MKRLVPFAALMLVVGLSAVGCSKSNSNQQNANGSANGPVSDSASSGLKNSGASGPMAGDAVHGKVIFTQNCAGCHGATGTQGGVGPSLKNEKARKDTAAAIAWIKNPKPPMPKLYPSPLSEKDVADVAAYVETL